MLLGNLEKNLTEDLKELFQEAYLKGTTQNKYPSVINRHQAKEILQVGDTKFSEIINREDFQFVKVKYTQGKFSHVNLLKWINNEK
ncbi:hypothetical protein P3U44_06915 [Mammaliicoccus sciuri]|uniref:hypothetical protein n=1 Tax=Mammaliicoccus sciuri TaxID=1296 RepID=UPI00194E4859|nr:hypothetical protein [Mammaliicoccus sciuri]WQJ75244.1 hypothetical protein P3U44_06915 [Mammaliicoccus sciuri]